MKKRLALAALLFPLTLSAAELTVSAASSLSDAFNALGKAYMQRHPDARVRFNFAASGVLLQQLRNGAPVGVLASADVKTMSDAAQAGLLAAPAREFAGNTLVVIVPAGQAAIALERAGKIAIGNPELVPAGRYAKAALQASGDWAALEARLIQTHNVRQVVDYVARGEVDAGIVYATDARQFAGKVKQGAALKQAPAIRYPIGVIKPASTEAQHFADFVLSAQGRAILAGFGFLP
ncbi:molybdate ABC transporter substrate-binding protein [Chitinibacteraceae bacterium HSL-7]